MAKLKLSVRYPIPNISDNLDKLGKYEYFKTINLLRGWRYKISQNLHSPLKIVTRNTSECRLQRIM